MDEDLGFSLSHFINDTSDIEPRSKHVQALFGVNLLCLPAMIRADLYFSGPYAYFF